MLATRLLSSDSLGMETLDVPCGFTLTGSLYIFFFQGKNGSCAEIYKCTSQNDCDVPCHLMGI